MNNVSKDTVMSFYNNLNDSDKRNFRRFGELIFCVWIAHEKMHFHIQNIEMLIEVFKSGLTDYYKEHFKERDDAVVLLSSVIENTRAKAYNKDEEFFTIMDLCSEIEEMKGLVKIHS